MKRLEGRDSGTQNSLPSGKKGLATMLSIGLGFNFYSKGTPFLLPIFPLVGAEGGEALKSEPLTLTPGRLLCRSPLYNSQSYGEGGRKRKG